jgi:putative Holliday junction resolvase
LGVVPEVGRVLGVDLGSRRVGIAVSDSAQRLAAGVTALPRSGDSGRDHARMAALAHDYEVVGVVVGLPLSLSGATGPAAKLVLGEIAELRESLGLPVETTDERFSTVAATSALRAAGHPGRKQRGVVDQTAAAVLLQGWLDRRAGTTRSRSE